VDEYGEFVAGKLSRIPSTGIDVSTSELPNGLFPHQVELVLWALRRGCAAIFADTGLGKTRMQLAWADAVHKHAGCDVLILAPLAVAAQTTAEGTEIGISVTHCRQADDVRSGINITNYDRLHKFDPSRFGAIVLDESSCIKHHDTKTLAALLESFRETPFKLCATATPAPNDWTELGTHAEFLGVCTRIEMLSEYFVHDGAETQVWRLKGHARHVFWRWVSTWGAMVRKPSDLGHDDSRYILPPLTVQDHVVRCEGYEAESGMLFALEASSLSERRAARKSSMYNRVAECARMVNGTQEPWIVWCDLNAEADALRAAIPDAVEIRGPDDVDLKEQLLADFAAGKIRVLVTKPSIAGWGVNWQHCARIAFVGVTDSFEAYYQAVRRCWRFGQKREVFVHVFASDMEGAVLANLHRKEADAKAMAEALSNETRAAVNAEVHGTKRMTNNYQPQRAIAAPNWLKTEAA
jgi:superfamily II DNA or RNA helicase